MADSSYLLADAVRRSEGTEASICFPGFFLGGEGVITALQSQTNDVMVQEGRDDTRKQ